MDTDYTWALLGWFIPLIVVEPDDRVVAFRGQAAEVQNYIWSTN